MITSFFSSWKLYSFFLKWLWAKRLPVRFDDLSVEDLAKKWGFNAEVREKREAILTIGTYKGIHSMLPGICALQQDTWCRILYGPAQVSCTERGHGSLNLDTPKGLHDKSLLTQSFSLLGSAEKGYVNLLSTASS